MKGLAVFKSGGYLVAGIGGNLGYIRFLTRRCIIRQGAAATVVTLACTSLRRYVFAVVAVVAVVTTRIARVYNGVLCNLVPLSRLRIFFESCVGCVGGRDFQPNSILKSCVGCVGKEGLPPTLPTLFLCKFESPHAQILASVASVRVRVHRRNRRYF